MKAYVCPKCGSQEPTHKCTGDVASGSLQPAGSASDLANETRYDKAVQELQNAARHFTMEWVKTPKESSFGAWSKACERLECAAVDYANAKTQNAPDQR